MLSVATLRTEREKREMEEFIEILKTLSEIEKAEVRGYVKGVSAAKFLVADSRKSGEEKQREEWSLGDFS